jgi:uncharacterized protein (TIGR00661 family)
MVKHKYAQRNVEIYSTTNEDFSRSMISSHAVLCGAGFETPSEALFINKKLMCIPIRNHFEQLCNAQALEELGVPIVKNIKHDFENKISNWLSDHKPYYKVRPADLNEVKNRLLALA